MHIRMKKIFGAAMLMAALPVQAAPMPSQIAPSHIQPSQIQPSQIQSSQIAPSQMPPSHVFEGYQRNPVRQYSAEGYQDAQGNMHGNCKNVDFRNRPHCKVRRQKPPVGMTLSRYAGE